MNKIIASTYELIEKLGSGGFGAVYLANHLRLHKKVILKADKRSINTAEKKLRREVDVLKELKHPNIPQVYDYFEEDGVVYTVMEYIEGESLDKQLDKEGKFDQPAVIGWAIQILEALCYLHEPIHGDPPHGYIHSDIKPANLMVRPDGTISLIDFNVSLALGDGNTYGISAGYASPEHYGSDYLKSVDVDSDGSQVTETKGKSDNTKSRLDARSDIYAVGATLYHLLSGKRPARDARKVEPLSKDKFSAPLVDIINKAMNPERNLRYQTAQEMMDAFQRLYDVDPRVRRWRAEVLVVSIVVAVLLIVGIPTAFIGLKRMQLTDQWLKNAEYSQNELTTGNVNRAIDLAMTAFQQKPSLLVPHPPAEAQYALTSALGLYELSDGYRVCNSVDLRANPSSIEISPDGNTMIAICGKYIVIIDTNSASVLAELETGESTALVGKFLNNTCVVYSAPNGVVCYDIAGRKDCWTSEQAAQICVSEDGSVICAVNTNGSAANLYRAKDSSLISTIDFGEERITSTIQEQYFTTNDDLIALNNNGSVLAVSFDSGSLKLFNTHSNDDYIELLQANSGYSHFEGGFYKQFFAFSATGDLGSAFAVYDTDNQSQRGGFQIPEGYFGTVVNQNGILVCEDNTLVTIDPVSGEPELIIESTQPIRSFSGDGTHSVIANGNDVTFCLTGNVTVSSWRSPHSIDQIAIAGGCAVIASENNPDVQILRYQDGSGEEVLKYEYNYPHDEARLSADGRTVMLFRYDRFRIYECNGGLISETEIPNAEDVYDQQYIRDGTQSSLQVKYRDGTISTYDANTGELRDRIQGEPPDSELYEVFETEDYRVESAFHENPVIYRKNAPKSTIEVSEEGYLTYVTQVRNYLILQYVTTDNHYYGILLNENGEKIAYLPNLCDVRDGMLLFDYPTGIIRKSKIYSLEEIVQTTTEEQHHQEEE